MSTLLEMATAIVTAQAQRTPMVTMDLVHSLKTIHASLQELESGVSNATETSIEEPATPSMTIKQAFRTNEVFCMVCGKGGMKTLTRHLNQAHQISPREYRKQFNIPKTQALMSKAYASKRKEIAAGMDLGANLEKARAARQVSLKKGKSKAKA